MQKSNIIIYNVIYKITILYIVILDLQKSNITIYNIVTYENTKI